MADCTLGALKTNPSNTTATARWLSLAHASVICPQIRAPSVSMVMLTTSVDIGGAPATRKWAFQTGALRLTQMAPASAENPVVTMVRGTHGSMNLLIAPRPDAAGPVLIGGIPIMPSELIQLDVSGFGDPFTGGKVLAAIELLPGETLDVAVPR